MTLNMAAETGLSRFLADFQEFMVSRGQEYKPFDPRRFVEIFTRIKSRFPKVKCVQVIGTNGKGSTAFFLSQMLATSNLKVGLFTSPHIFCFNERIVFDGKAITDDELELEHTKLQELLNNLERESISYFEYSALIGYSFLSKRSDIIILEAGLGGEFDATTVFDSDLLLVSEIDDDHKEILGENIEAIAATKLRAISSHTVIGSDKGIVFRIASQIATIRGQEVNAAFSLLGKNELNMAEAHVKKLNWPKFQEQNLILAMAGAKILGVKIDKKILPKLAPKGRFEKISPNIIIDVGHNPACAKAVAQSISKVKPILVFNTLAGKEYEKSLAILAPRIKRVEIIDIDDERAMPKESLERILESLGLAYGDFKSIDENESYLVFGSFLTVAKFLRSLS
jgi:dihydrofolate synthase / folylpolyglutamate synthase